jgi:hypothetical protein
VIRPGEDNRRGVSGATTSASLRKLAAALGEFATYIANNARHIVNYGERWECQVFCVRGFREGGSMVGGGIGRSH